MSGESSTAGELGDHSLIRIRMGERCCFRVSSIRRCWHDLISRVLNVRC